MNSYQITTKLDLGDLGQVDATVDGSVSESGLFGDGSGYFQAKIQKVVAHIPIFPGSPHSTDLDVTFILGKAAAASIFQELEELHESEKCPA